MPPMPSATADRVGKPRWKRLLSRLAYVVGTMLVIAGAALYGLFVYFLNVGLSHRVEVLEATPATYGLPGETVSLAASDGIPLKAWWVAADASKPRGVVVLLHGMDGLDASALLGHAKFLHDAGYSAMALDMRAHGRSGGQRIGSSIEEPRDVMATLDWIKKQPQLAGAPVVLLGISMGGATALRTAAVRPDVAAVISVSAFCSVNQSLREVLPLMGVPKAVVPVVMPFISLAAQCPVGGRYRSVDTIVLQMDAHFRPIRKETVMCTVQGCLHVATFVFAGCDRGAGGRSVVGAYCHQHAEEAATRVGHPWPIPERLPEERVVGTRILRAG